MATVRTARSPQDADATESGTAAQPGRQPQPAPMAVTTPALASMRRALGAALACTGLLAAVGAGTSATTGRWAGPLTALACAAVLLPYGLLAIRFVARSDDAVRAAELDTEASHDQLQELIDNTSAVIYMKRVDNGQYLLVNREWERLFGVTRDTVVNC